MTIGNAITQIEADAGTRYLDAAGVEITKAFADALTPLSGWVVVDRKRRKYPPTPVVDTQAAQDVKIAATESRLQKKVSSSLMFAITKAREEGSLTLAQLQTIEDNVDARITLNSDVVVDGDFDPIGDTLTVSDDKGGADLPVTVGAASIGVAALWSATNLTVQPAIKPTFTYWLLDSGGTLTAWQWSDVAGGPVQFDGGSLWAPDPLTTMPTAKPVYKYWMFKSTGSLAGPWYWSDDANGPVQVSVPTGAGSGTNVKVTREQFAFTMNQQSTVPIAGEPLNNIFITVYHEGLGTAITDGSGYTYNSITKIVTFDTATANAGNMGDIVEFTFLEAA